MSKLYVYADDVMLVKTFEQSVSKAYSASVTVNNDLQLISDWSIVNGLVKIHIRGVSCNEFDLDICYQGIMILNNL